MCNSSPLQPILAMIGHPVAGNPAQYLEKAFAQHELDWRYLSLDVAPDDLAAAIRGFRAMGFRGGNCTAPHKQAVLLHLDRNTQTAELAGSVNCILREENQFVGENTEGKAVVAALRRHIDLPGKRIALVGAGPVARAIGVELALAAAGPITVVNRSEPAGRHLVEILTNPLKASASWVPWEGDYAVPAETDVLIHATRIGAGDGDARAPLALDGLSKTAIVVDLVADPPHTQLIAEAQERGLRTVDGLELYVEQAAISFRLWTTLELDRAVISEAVEEYLEL